MGFPLPNFNLLGNWWQTPHLPSTGLPDIVNFKNALYLDPHAPLVFIPVAPYSSTLCLTIIIKVPAFTYTFHRGDILMPDNTVASYFKVEFAEVFFRGFPQQYEGVLVRQCNANGTIPRTY